MSARRVLIVAIAGIVVFALDRLTKAAVVADLALDESVDVVGPYVRITHVRNTGAAFGLLPERTTLLSVLSVLAVVAIVYYYRSLAMTSPWLATTLGMQLGGALGNLVDRVGQGYVVDFIDVGLVPGPRFWAFNVADSGVVVGISVTVGLLWLAERRAPRTA